MKILSADKRAQIRQLFMTYGIKSLTMEDLARHLRCSKKTLYTEVKDKNDLVEQCIKGFVNETSDFINKIDTNKYNAIEELMLITQHMLNRMGDFHPSVLFDLEKFHPESLAHIEEFKKNTVYNKLHLNLEKGISQGYYRENMNKEFILSLYFTVMDSIHKDQFKFQQENAYSFRDAILEFLRYHVRGIASEKGVKYLSKTINQFS